MSVSEVIGDGRLRIPRPRPNGQSRRVRRCALLVALGSLAAVVPGPAGAQVEEERAVPDDVRTLGGLMRAYYEVVSAGPEERRDFARDSLLHHPAARVGMMGEEPDGEPWLRTMTLGEYHQMLRPTAAGFYERELGRVTRRFGHLVHVWSAYAWRAEVDGPDLGRGINSLQLYHDGRRWWILSWFFDSERPDNPLPRELSTPGGG